MKEMTEEEEAKASSFADKIPFRMDSTDAIGDLSQLTDMFIKAAQ